MVPGCQGARVPVRKATALAVLAMLCFWATPPALRAQVPGLSSDRFKGLQWTFVRIKYNSWEDEGGAGSNRLAYWDEPWAIDGPAAEQNLSRRLKSVTAIEVGEPVVLQLEDEKLWQYPWIYMVEP